MSLDEIVRWYNPQSESEEYILDLVSKYEFTEIEELKSEIQNLKDENDEYDRKVEQLENEISDLESENKNLETKVDDLLEQVSDFRRNRKKLN